MIMTRPVRGPAGGEEGPLTLSRANKGDPVKSAEFFKSVIDSIGDPIFVKDEHHTFVFANRAACEALGFPLERWLGKSDYDLFPREQADVFRMHDRYVLETGEERTNEELITDSRGTVHTIVTKKRLHVGADGARYVVGVIRDITDRKQAEDALLESEVKYRALVESSLAGVFVYQDGFFRFVNRRFCEIYGYPRDEIVDRLSADALLHPEDRSFVRSRVDECRAGKTDSVSLVHRALRKDGSTITVNVLANPTVYRGRPALSGTVVDVTDREKAEARLREKTALLEAQMNASLDGIIIVDRGKKVIQNRQAANLLRIPEQIAADVDDEAQVRWVESQAKDPAHFRETVAQFFADREMILRDEVELKDGSVLERYTGPVVGSDGTHYGRILTFRDITERKRSEEALRTSQLRLAEAMDLAHIVYWQYDPLSGTAEFNDPFYAFYGTTAAREGAYRMTPGEYGRRFVHPGDLSLFVNHMKEHPFSAIEYRILRRDGEVRHILTRARAVRDQQGRIIQVHGANQDITGRKHMEETLRESEEKFRRLFQESMDPMLLICDGRFIDCNLAAVKLMGGRSRDEIIGLSPVDLSPERQPDGSFSSDKAREVDERTLREGANRFEWMRRSLTGREFWVDVSHTVIPIKGRKIFHTVWRDISERKRGEEMVRRYELLGKRNRDICLFIDMDGSILEANDAAEAAYGYAKGELLTLRVQDLITPEAVDSVSGRIALAAAGGVLFETAHRRKDGTLFSVEVSADRATYNGKEVLLSIIRDISSRKEAEESLRESEAFNRRLFESNRTAIVVMDAKTARFIDCNPAAVHIYHVPDRGDVVGKAPLDFSAPAQYNGKPSAEGVVYYMDKALKEGFAAFEWLHRRPDGSLWDGMIHLMPFQSRGRILMQFSLYDITEQKKTEKALTEAEAKYRTIFENSSMGIYQTSLDGRILSANPALARILGYDSPRELMESVHDTTTDVCAKPGDRVAFTRLCLEHGRMEGIEAECLRKDGTTVWVSLNARTVTDPRGGVSHFEGTVEDITARKRAEEELRAAHQRLFDIIEFLPDATFVIDGKKRVVAWNRACEEMTGVKKEEIMGRDDYSVPFYGTKRPLLIDYVAMDARELDAYQAVSRKGGRLYGETFVPAVYGGKGAILSGHASPLYDAQGRVVGAIECITDITEVKQLEMQFRQSQKMEAIGTLAGGIAHDFNNILTALIGYAALLRMDTEHTPARVYVDQILSASHKAADLVQSLLTFSRQRTIAPRPISIHRVIEGTEKLLQRLLTEDITIRIPPPDHDMVVMADPTQIDQILFNLATNARDAMPKGGTLTIETLSMELGDEFYRLHGYGKPGPYVVLSVSDTGTGMDEVTRERIFDPFFTTKEAGKGTGLGLSTVYGIVKQHGGYVAVYSEPGVGTTVHVYLPAVPDRSTEEPAAPAPVRGGIEKVLVAEDNEAVRLLMSRVLTEYGYTPIEAKDGADAVEKFRASPAIDLLILDSVMPGMNGREAYNEIRKVRPDTRVIFTSGYTRDVILDKGIEDREFNFLQKPISPEALLRKVREVLDGNP